MTRMATDFVPADLDASAWERVEPYVRALLDRDPATTAEAERWLLDRSELDAACSETGANLYIAMTCATDDEAAQGAYLRFIEHVRPKLKQAAFDLDRHQAGFCRRLDLAGKSDRYTVLVRNTEADVSIFRPENVPIFTETEKLENEYQKITGRMTVTFRGQERTLPQMGRFLEEQDRATREEAWRLVAKRRLEDREAIEQVFDDLVRHRHAISRHAGFNDFVGYTFAARHRFDYTPRHCEDFHRACEEVVVPFNRRLDERRRSQLNLRSLRPWDLAVDPKGRAPLRPFEGGRDLVARSLRAFERLDAGLAEMFRSLGDGSNDRGPIDGECLDLDSRRGKAPGGYLYMRDRRRLPFIFMNAAGLHRDVETMVHEAGHAFHGLLAADEPLLHYREAPIEFCEVASMSMELLTMPHWSSYYADSEDLARAQRRQLEGSVSLLPWIATIDAFQHWIYTHPDHTRDQRRDAWLALDDRFGHDVDWTGLEDERAFLWHRQPHPFTSPLYYIEYGIAQLGALQLWLLSIERGPSEAIEAYKSAMRLGGSRPLPELFKAAGLAFDFGPSIVARLVDRVERELEKLPE